MISALVIDGMWASLTGVLLGGVIALLGKNNAIQRIAQTVLMAALFLGALASGIFLWQNLPAIALFNSDWLLPGRLVLDHLSALFFFLITAVGFFTVGYTARYIQNEGSLYSLPYIQFLTALFILGMQLVVLATQTAFFLFGWEVMSLASFLLVIADFKTGSIRPAIFYLIITHLGAGALLAGFLLLTGGHLSADFSQMAEGATQLTPGLLFTAFWLFFFGFGSKAGLFPFHGWLPEAHPQAPSPISALMSAIMLKMAVYGFLRVVLFILPVLPLSLGVVVLAIGLLSAIFGVLYAVSETDIKRILAFSSIENLGLIFAMIGLMMVAKTLHLPLLAEITLVALLFQSVCHAFFKSGLFLSAGIMGHIFHTRNIEKMGGLAKQMPWFSGAVLLLCLTAAALPPSGAFISEWIMLESIVSHLNTTAAPMQAILLTLLVGFSFVAGMAVFAMVRFFGIAFLARPRSKSTQLEKDPVPEFLVPVMVLSLVAFLLGAFAPLVTRMIGSSIFSPAQENLITNSFHLSTVAFNPLLLLMLFLITLLAAYLLRRVAARRRNERLYHSWDCGQPIDASMEFTGTAFAAPLRFFFRPILRAKKQIHAEPLLPSNPWIMQKRITLEARPLWEHLFYQPLVRLMTLLSSLVRRLQNGIVQLYIALIFLTLVITALIIL